jgi:SAM-dependent methyltransferase
MTLMARALAVFERRRAEVLGARLPEFIPACSSVLDVGAGDGRIARLVAERRPELTIQGVDVLVRPDAAIPIAAFDGRHLPYADKRFDTVLFVDVLHHTDDPSALLREAARVARETIVIKDHIVDGPLGTAMLKFQDWLGNARYGVALPYNFWRHDQWLAAFAAIGAELDRSIFGMHYWGWPGGWLLDRQFHFIARLHAPRAAA